MVPPTRASGQREFYRSKDRDVDRQALVSFLLMGAGAKVRRYGNFFIHVAVKLLEDGTYTPEGFIRKPRYDSDPPFSTSFRTDERHPTEQEALEAGTEFAKRRIDELTGLAPSR